MTYGSGNSGNYKKLKGQTIQVTDTDPIVYSGSWSTGGTMNTGRTSSTGTGSGSSDHIIAGGYYLPPSVDRSATETYNGTSWTEVADCPADLTYGNGLGSSTASLLCGYARPGPAPGGFGPTTDSHLWNGSSWSNTNSMNTFRQFGGTAGSTTAGLVFGGSGPPAQKINESWDGTSWTETTDMNTAKTDIGGGCGTQTAAISASGLPATTEVWDGSSWTEVAEINTARFNSSKIGISTSALCAGGQTPSTFLANTEEWNGSSWTEVSDLPAVQGYAGGTSPTGSAGATDGLFAGGGNSPTNSATYEWTFPSTPVVQEGQLWIKTATGASSVMKGYAAQGTGAWATGGNLNTGRNDLDGAGTQTAGLAFGGNPATGATEEYNGSSWSESGDLNTARRALTGFGLQTAAIAAGGSEGPYNDEVEQYDGSSWTEIAEINTATGGTVGSCGTTTAGLVFGRRKLPGATKGGETETWNGSSWTEVGDMNTARFSNAGAGVQTSALSVNGAPGPGLIEATESWNGSAWTEVADTNNSRQDGAASGATNTSILFFGGSTGSGVQAHTEQWDGSSWTELANMSAPAAKAASADNSTLSSFLAGGDGPPGAAVATTEEWNVPLVTKTIGTD